MAKMRKQQNLTQRGLADILNISDKTVSKWESGNGMPDLSLILPVCEVLKISLNELFSGGDIRFTSAFPLKTDNLFSETLISTKNGIVQR